MPIVILLLYIVALTLALTYALGGVGIGLGIVLGLAFVVAAELFHARHDENRRAALGPGHHHDAHGGRH
jgi:hypothetical protein